MTVDDFEYLRSTLKEKKARKNLKIQGGSKKRAQHWRSPLRDDQPMKFDTGLQNCACFDVTLNLILPYTENVK